MSEVKKKDCEQEILNAIAGCAVSATRTSDAKVAIYCAIAAEKLSNAYVNLKDIKED